MTILQPHLWSPHPSTHCHSLLRRPQAEHPLVTIRSAGSGEEVIYYVSKRNGSVAIGCCPLRPSREQQPNVPDSASACLKRASGFVRQIIWVLLPYLDLLSPISSDGLPEQEPLIEEERMKTAESLAHQWRQSRRS